MEDLKRKRATVKSNLTRFIYYLDGPGKTDDANTLDSWLKSRTALLEKYEDMQAQIEDLVAAGKNEDEITAEEKDREQFEMVYFSAMGRAQALIDKARRVGPESTTSRESNHSASTTNRGSNQGTSPQIGGVNLPKMNMSSFDGDCGQWIKFRDMFKSVIHENNALNDIQKFSYLNSFLKGKATNVIAEISVSEEDYQEAWKTLCERYDDDTALLSYHVEGLHTTPALTSDSPKDLRQLIDNTKNHLKALQKLVQHTQHWDILIIYILTNKLNVTMKREWECERMHSKNKPSLEGMFNFLEEYCKFLKNTSTKSTSQEAKGNNKDNATKVNNSKRGEQAKSFADTTKTYPLCSNTHGLYACPQFKELSVADRTKKVSDLKLCFNCLCSGHQNKKCKFGPCRRCGRRHHALLHVDTPRTQTALAINEESTGTPAQSDPQLIQSTYLASRNFSHEASYVLLGTANVYLLDRRGKAHQCRALLDSGSQAHIMTSDCCKRLNLDCQESGITLSGIEQGGRIVRHKATVKMISLATKYSATITCLIMDKISDNLPNALVKSAGIEIPKGVELADPNYDKSAPIDLLIGAALFYELLCVGQIKLTKNQPILQKTLLGWIVTGSIKFPQKSFICNFVNNNKLNDQLERFWKVENFYSETASPLQLKNDYCERHFISTTTKEPNGRFVVRIPFKEEVTQLGNSREMALKWLYHLEGKLAKNSELRAQYITFMREYEDLCHMTQIPAEELEATKHKPHFYLPHHAVMKETSTTTKLPVVFDGSAKTSSGISLNDVEYVGPVVQGDLFCIVVRPRLHRYAMSADVTKMYRQVKVIKKQRRFQRIVWREDPSQPIRDLELNTVTYGTSSAAYLAKRSLQEVGNKNKIKYPRACSAICEDFYVDDVYTGADTIAEAIALKNELITLLGSVGMELRKWASNEPKIINNEAMPQDGIIFHGDEDLKTLGLIWDPVTDTLRYCVNSTNNNKVTKRVIMSIIAQIFDPLGLVGPAIIQAKIIFQKLWTLNVTWDESLPQDVHELWTQIYGQLIEINKISIPRCVKLDDCTSIEVHGFCDASEKAYGACVYICTQNQGGRRAVQLLCAKSRVAPLKALTLTRLELLGAVLLAQLASKLIKTCNLPIDIWHFWTDSTVVLAWLKAPPLKWKTFVANRTAEIKELTNSSWRHVQSEFNPADLISRGINADELKESKLWWHGPSWLTQDKKYWPSLQQLDTELISEQRKQMHILIAQEINSIENFKIEIDKQFNKLIFERSSTFTHLIRTIAFVIRFINNCKTMVTARKDGSAQVQNRQHPNRFIALHTDELRHATQKLITLVQAETFSEDIFCLKKVTKICKTSNLNQLNPFLDNDGILRVSGRLENADLSFEQRHPILLSPHHKLTHLLIWHEHRRLLHAGNETVLLSLRTRYWPLTGKKIVKNVLSRCITCFRANPTDVQPMMGNLPVARVNPTCPFYNSGVDYAGPFLIKEKTHSRTSIKAYVCIFVCFATKATHIELAVNLSAEAFLNCLRRFIARRGRCANIYSDNGTNFVGSNNELRELKNLLRDSNFRQQIVEFGNGEHINWHFIPPRAPHFGGLWEGAAKSAKYHLKRVIGETRLSYEEFSTILTQVEACLNSRPLYPLSNDPNDFTPLTPSHFLIGDLLTGLPEGDLREHKQSRLNRYQHLRQMLQHFWQRWQREYLPHLQKRQKWTNNARCEIKLDTMVLIKEENTPPMQWRLGRIVELHPGKDGVTRVVSIRISKGIIKRPLVKICPLPIEDLTSNASTDN